MLMRSSHHEGSQDAPETPEDTVENPAEDEIDEDL